jgi:hypothetical protein
MLTKDADSVDSPRPIPYSTSDRTVERAPTFSPRSSLTHAHRSIGYRNHNPQPLVEFVTRLMYLRVLDQTVIPQCPVLSHLNLRDNNIGAGGTESLEGVMGQCPVLVQLNLWNNQIGASVTESLARVLS